MTTEKLTTHTASEIESFDAVTRRYAHEWNSRVERAERLAGCPLWWERLSRDHGRIVMHTIDGLDVVYGRDEVEALDRLIRGKVS
jgi:hypothetical protein